MRNRPKFNRRKEVQEFAMFFVFNSQSAS